VDEVDLLMDGLLELDWHDCLLAQRMQIIPLHAQLMLALALSSLP